MAIKEFPSLPTPSIKGQSGKYLTTNGSSLSWGTVATDKTISQIASGSITSGTSLSLISLSNYDTLKFRFSSVTTNNAYNITATINGTSSNYDWVKVEGASNSTDWSEWNRNTFSTSNSSIGLNGTSIFNSNADNCLQLDLTNCKSTGFTFFEWTYIYRIYASTSYYGRSHGRGVLKSAAAVNSLEINCTATFTAGNYVLWGA